MKWAFWGFSIFSARSKELFKKIWRLLTSTDLFFLLISRRCYRDSDAVDFNATLIIISTSDGPFHFNSLTIVIQFIVFYHDEGKKNGRVWAVSLYHLPLHFTFCDMTRDVRRPAWRSLYIAVKEFLCLSQTHKNIRPERVSGYKGATSDSALIAKATRFPLFIFLINILFLRAWDFLIAYFWGFYIRKIFYFYCRLLTARRNFCVFQAAPEVALFFPSIAYLTEKLLDSFLRNCVWMGIYTQFFPPSQ